MGTGGKVVGADSDVVAAGNMVVVVAEPTFVVGGNDGAVGAGWVAPVFTVGLSTFFAELPDAKAEISSNTAMTAVST